MNRKQVISLLIAIMVPLVFLLILLAIFSFPLMLLCVLLLVIAVVIIKTKFPDLYNSVLEALSKNKEKATDAPEPPKPFPAHTSQKAHMTLIGVSAYNRKSIVINSDSFTIGRDPSCDLVLDNIYISKRHLTITFDETDKLCYVMDHSTGGTFLNSERLPKNQRRALKQGDTLQIANVAYTVEFAHY